MNKRKKFLKDTLAGESRAYGFTVAFWGSGAMLVKYAGLPGLIEALLYGFGATIGFGVMALYVYSGPFVAAGADEVDELLVASMIHYIGALLPIVSASYTAMLASPLNFFVTGLMAVMLYNLGMIAEVSLSEKAESLERKFFETI